MSRPVVLVTNDDGIDSFFLALLVEALLPRFEVRVVAPLREQSWTGRAFSRRTAVAVTEVTTLGVPAWAVDGTPSDCVNIGLGCLLAEAPAAVVSGINLGFNVSLPLALSSGTIAGATEGALAGLPAVALSQTVQSERFEAVWRSGGRGDAKLEATVRVAAARSAAFIDELLRAPMPSAPMPSTMPSTPMPSTIPSAPVPSRPVVHSLNFPGRLSDDTPMERTRLAPVRLGGCFVMGDDRAYRFRFPAGSILAAVDADTDLACVMRGHISHTVLDYGALGALSG